MLKQLSAVLSSMLSIRRYAAVAAPVGNPDPEFERKHPRDEHGHFAPKAEDVAAHFKGNIAPFKHGDYALHLLPERGSDSWTAELHHPDGRVTEHDAPNRRDITTRDAAIKAGHKAMVEAITGTSGRRRKPLTAPVKPPYDSDNPKGTGDGKLLDHDGGGSAKGQPGRGDRPVAGNAAPVPGTDRPGEVPGVDASGTAGSVPNGANGRREGVRGNDAANGGGRSSEQHVGGANGARLPDAGGGGESGAVRGGRSERGDVGRGGSVLDPPRPQPIAEVAAAEATPENPIDLAAGNWRYHNRDFFRGEKGGKKSRYKANVEALKTLRAIQAEGRDVATPDEQAKLANYVGWGAFPELFGYDPDWERERSEFAALVPDLKDREGAKRSTINAHFTHPDVVDAHWKMLRRLGFDGGRFLEPSVGVGYYMGMMPPEVASRTAVAAVELDPTSAAITKLLYPSAHVANQGFEEFAAPDNFYDVVASNVPFFEKGPHDNRYNSFRASLHDYFFLKSVDVVKPGGVVAHITSTGTMDKPAGANVRQHLADTCDLLGAVRFPGGAHKENAGTDVVTDMLILRKRPPGMSPPPMDVTPAEAEPKQPGFTGVTTDALGRVYHWVDGKRVPHDHWVETDTVKLADGEPANINKYWASHPDQVLGTLDHTGTMHREGSLNVSRTDDYDERLEHVINGLPENILKTGPATHAPDHLQALGEHASEVKEGGYFVDEDGTLVIRSGNVFRPAKISKDAELRVRGMLSIRDAAHAALAVQAAGGDASDARARLNAAYDEFAGKYGAINAKKNRSAIKGDPDSHFLRALEKWDKDKNEATKADIFSKDTVNPNVIHTHADTAADALGIALAERGSVDIDRIATLLGKSPDAVGKELVARGLAFNDPSDGWQPASLYLAGNVRQKLAAARHAATMDKAFQPNVDALEKVQPEDVPYDEIGVKLGAHWVAASDVRQFAKELIGGWADSDKVFEVGYVPEAGEWVFGFEKGREADWAKKSAAAVAAGTDYVPFAAIMNYALNGGSPKVVELVDGKETVNKQATQDAQAKIQEVKDKFADWVWNDPERRQRLHRYYNDNFNNIRDVEFDGSHLTFPGMNPAFKMRDIQRNFVWRVLTTGRGLAAHEVGTGKTASMIAAAMELRRTGLAKKPVLACLKANIEQITREAYELYPGAKILSTADQFTADKRKDTIAKIAAGDYDLVIMTHDNLEMLPMRPEVKEAYIRDELRDIDAAIAAAEAANPGKKNNRIVKRLEKQKLKLDATLKEALDDAKKDDAIFFEQTGIDQLFVDEAHKFKTLPVSSHEQIKGIPTGRSDRATDLLMRTRWLEDNHKGRGVVFCTGTPVSNTMAELFNMQRFLMPRELKERGLDKFDAWKNAFGDTQTKTEFTVGGDYQPVSRFSKFTNLPELMQLTGNVMDVQRADSMKKPDGSPVIVRPKRHDHMIVAPETDSVKAMMGELRKRAQEIKANPYNTKDNMLAVCGDGKKASIDLRMYDPSLPDDPNSKANQCVANVLREYKSGPADSTQIIFSDLGVHKLDNGFHLYADLINKLVAGGIPREQIADFGTLEGEAKDQAQDLMRKGKIRVALGSTERLGTGTNVQRKVWAMHHLDCPWVPAFIEQRDGRGWRHGNFNDPSKPAHEQNVHIFRYVTEGSLDQTFWQAVATKAGFINQVINRKGGGGKLRSAAEIDTETLTPEEMMAAASGDPRIIERVQLEQEQRELLASEVSHRRDQSHLTSTVDAATKKQVQLKSDIADYLKDSKHVASRDAFAATIHSRGEFTDRAKAAEAWEEAAAMTDHQEFDRLSQWQRKEADPVDFGEYKGLKVYRAPDASFLLQGPSGKMYRTGDSLASVEAVARSIAKKHADAVAEHKRGEESVATATASIGAAWPKAAKLADVQKRLRELDGEIRKERAVASAPSEEDVEQYARRYGVSMRLARILYSRQLSFAFADEQPEDPEFERKHPRASDGKFAEKGDADAGDAKPVAQERQKLDDAAPTRKKRERSAVRDALGRNEDVFHDEIEGTDLEKLADQLGYDAADAATGKRSHKSRKILHESTNEDGTRWTVHDVSRDGHPQFHVVEHHGDETLPTMRGFPTLEQATAHADERASPKSPKNSESSPKGGPPELRPDLYGPHSVSQDDARLLLGLSKASGGESSGRFVKSIRDRVAKSRDSIAALEAEMKAKDISDHDLLTWVSPTRQHMDELLAFHDADPSVSQQPLPLRDKSDDGTDYRDWEHGHQVTFTVPHGTPKAGQEIHGTFEGLQDGAFGKRAVFVGDDGIERKVPPMTLSPRRAGAVPPPPSAKPAEAPPPTAKRQATLRWLAKRVWQATNESLGGGGNWNQEPYKHWEEKALRILEEDPKDAQGVQDALVNFKSMRGQPVGRFDRAPYESLVKDIAERDFIHHDTKQPIARGTALPASSPAFVKQSDILNAPATPRVDRGKASKAVAKLREAAETLAGHANEALGAERKDNTWKRANQAAQATNRALADEALAKTMHAVADHIESGEAKHLGSVSQKTHLEALDSALYRARNKRFKSNYSEGERRKHDPYEDADVEHAEWPWPAVHVASLNGVLDAARGKKGVESLRELGETIRSSLAFERDNPTFGKLRNVGAVATLGKFLKAAKAMYIPERHLSELSWHADDHNRLLRAGISPETLSDALREYLPLKTGRKKADPVKEMERAIRFTDIPGFFPTPAALVDKMIDRANIQPGDKVLEPSAGKGDILDAVRERHPDVETHGIEINHSLAEILKAKGHSHERGDFLDHKGEYDKVLMNPPFEGGQDIDHVRHAYDRLKPGGTLVAVMSSGPFSRSQKKDFAFRDWLEQVGGEVEDNPDGTFAGADAFRQTGVSTKLVRIHKPSAEGYAMPSPDKLTIAPHELTRRQNRQFETARSRMAPPPVMDAPRPHSGGGGHVPRPPVAPTEHVGVHPLAPHMHAATMALGPEHVAALRDYTKHEVALPMNRAVRANPALQGVEPEHAANYHRVQTAIRAAGTLPQPVETWRGVNGRTGARMLAMANAALNGSRVIETHGISSTTLHKPKAVEYSKGPGGALVRTVTKSGAYLEGITHAPGEHEIAVPHGSRYYVHGITHEEVDHPEHGRITMPVVHLEQLV